MSDTETEQLALTIKASGNKTYDVTVGSDTSVSALKQTLEGLSSIPQSQQRLIYSGRVLKDPDTLDKYKIKSGHALHLVKGAAPKAASTEASAPGGTAAARGAPAPAMAAGTGTGNPLADLTGARYSGLASLPSASLFGPDGGAGPQGIDDLGAIMNDPEMLSSVANVLQDPDMFMNMNPRLRDLPLEQRQRIRQTIQSPEFRELITNPDRMRQMMQTMQQLSRLPGFQDMAGMGGDPFGMGGMGAGAAGIPGFGAGLGGDVGAGGATGGATGDAGAGTGSGAGAGAGFGGWPPMMFPPTAPQDTRPPEERYELQLRQLNELGFHDFERNVQALRRSGGNVEGAVSDLLGD